MKVIHTPIIVQRVIKLFMNHIDAENLNNRFGKSTSTEYKSEEKIGEALSIFSGLALGVASPLAYYFMNSWLHDFAYKIDINIVPFIIAGVGALSVALLTISYQVVKAARTNPVNTLKYE